MFSYSKVSTHSDCPYKYKLIYVDKLKALDNITADNALFVGTAAHTGVEKRSINEALDNYKSNYTDFTDDHEMEMYKLKLVLENAINQIPEGEYEYKLLGEDGYIGYIDVLVKVDDGLYDIYDIKCSNNISGYLSSPQVMIYKYYFEQLTGNKVRDLYYAFIPKYKESSTDLSLDERKAEVDKKFKHRDVRIEKVDYDETLVYQFMKKKDEMEHDEVFNKVYSWKCKWCEFNKFCRSRGRDRSELKEDLI